PPRRVHDLDLRRRKARLVAGQQEQPCGSGNRRLEQVSLSKIGVKPRDAGQGTQPPRVPEDGARGTTPLRQQPQQLGSDRSCTARDGDDHQPSHRGGDAGRWATTSRRRRRPAISRSNGPSRSHYNFITSPDVLQIVGKFLTDPLTNPPTGAAAVSQAAASKQTQ